MVNFSFELNNKPMSALIVIGTQRSFPAFSGLGQNVNKRSAACVPDLGPIPPGKYYIVNRESGGRLGWLYDLFAQKESWFALYAADSNIDDETFCETIKRGQFRLHPKVGRGISKGCITIDKQRDFNMIYSVLSNTETELIPDTEIKAYGTVTVS